MELGKGELVCGAAGSPLSTQASRAGQGEEGGGMELGSQNTFHIAAPSVNRIVKLVGDCTHKQMGLSRTNVARFWTSVARRTGFVPGGMMLHRATVEAKVAANWM